MIVISKAQTFECTRFVFDDVLKDKKSIVFYNHNNQRIHEILNCTQEDYNHIAYQAGGYPTRAINIMDIEEKRKYVRHCLDND